MTEAQADRMLDLLIKILDALDKEGIVKEEIKQLKDK